MGHELRQDRLGLANDKQVHKGSQGLGIDEGGHPAANNQRLSGPEPAGVCGALFRQRLDPPGKKQSQQVEKILFKTQGAEHNRKIAEGAPRFQGNRGLVVLVKKPLADEAGQAVYQGIDKLEAKVGVTKAVTVGKDEGNWQQPLPFFALRPFFAGKKITGCRLALTHGGPSRTCRREAKRPGSG